MEEENNQNIPDNRDNRVQTPRPNQINSHFTLAVAAVVLSCFTGFWTIPVAVAALILSLRAQDLEYTNRIPEAQKTASWAAAFGWITILLAAVPLIAMIFFGGAIVALLAAIATA